MSPSVFFTEFYDFIEKIYINLKNIIILGDFNLHMNKAFDKDVIRFNNIISTFCLTQLIDKATHMSGNTLDLLITNQNETKIQDIKIDDVNYSDHSLIFFRVPFEYQKPEKKVISFKDYNSVDLGKFKNDISHEVVNFTSKDHTVFHEALDEYNSLCKKTVNNYVQSKTINISNARPKWMDLEFLKSRALRRKLYKRWVRTRNRQDRFDYVEARENTQSLSIEKQKAFYSQEINNAKNSQKALFSICKNLLDVSKSRILPSYTCSFALANKFNDYFIDKIEKIRNNFPKAPRPVLDVGLTLVLDL